MVTIVHYNQSLPQLDEAKDHNVMVIIKMTSHATYCGGSSLTIYTHRCYIGLDRTLLSTLAASNQPKPQLIVNVFENDIYFANYAKIIIVT